MQWGPDAGAADLRALIDSHLVVDASDPLCDVGERLDRARAAFAAVGRHDRVLGLCSRSRIRRLLGGRYGFSLHSRRPVGETVTAGDTIVRYDTSLREVLRTALSRPGDAFYRDIVVTGSDGRFEGLISTRRLVAAQSALVEDQFASLAASLARQHELERTVFEKEKLALLETLAGGIAHEINNKLHPIVAHAELLAEEADVVTVDAIRASAQSMLRCALESSRIITQLLRLSRPPRSELGPCDLRDVVEQSLTLADLRARGTAIQLHAELPSDRALVLADAGQIKQVVMNLLVNAIDAVEGAAAPAVTVAVTLTDQAATLSVADTGTGIAAEHLRRIFDPFFTTKDPGRGSGLGLGVSAAILRQHGTAIAVDSTPGAGSCFRFTLPRITDTDAGLGESAVPLPARTGLSRVLVVDDDATVRGVIDHSLRRLLGCAVDQARDGLEGQEALGRLRYDAVLCDVRMPGMNGVELVRWLAGQPHQPRPRTVLMTGDGGEALGQEMETTGAVVLRKPFTMTRLVEVLLAGREASQAPGGA